MIAHIIAIILLLMARIGDDNWIVKHGLIDADWS